MKYKSTKRVYSLYFPAVQNISVHINTHKQIYVVATHKIKLISLTCRTHAESKTGNTLTLNH